MHVLPQDRTLIRISSKTFVELAVEADRGGIAIRQHDVQDAAQQATRPAGVCCLLQIVARALMPVTYMNVVLSVFLPALVPSAPSSFLSVTAVCTQVAGVGVTAKPQRVPLGQRLVVHADEPQKAAKAVKEGGEKAVKAAKEGGAQAAKAAKEGGEKATKAAKEGGEKSAKAAKGSATPAKGGGGSKDKFVGQYKSVSHGSSLLWQLQGYLHQLLNRVQLAAQPCLLA